MGERRYDDTEADTIFRVAAEGVSAPPRPTSAKEGLTLADLQKIGSEAGIPATDVTRAALTLDLRREGPGPTLLGLPVGVRRTVDLPRRLTDEEWERLVVRCREVFDARGATRAEGTLRQWTNGNLQVLLEPTETGHRLRFRTRNSQAQASIGLGVAGLGVAAAVAVAAAVSGTLGHAIPGIAFLATVGLGALGNGALRLPRWARLRGRQMEELAVEAASGTT